jgi:hypothetical protein
MFIKSGVKFELTYRKKLNHVVLSEKVLNGGEINTEIKMEKNFSDFKKKFFLINRTDVDKISLLTHRSNIIHLSKTYDDIMPEIIQDVKDHNESYRYHKFYKKLMSPLKYRSLRLNFGKKYDFKCLTDVNRFIHVIKHYENQDKHVTIYYN